MISAEIEFMRVKFYLSIIFILVTLLPVACKKSNSVHDKASGTGIALQSCGENKIEPYICFDSVIEESRCPAGAECVWQGTALIKISFHERTLNHQFIMSLKNFPSLGYPSDTTINGYNIIFTKLEPYPNLSQQQQQTTAAYFTITP